MANSETSNKAEGRKIPKPNNMIKVKTTPDEDFFKWWCVFLRPFIPLTKREIDVIASFLRHRWELSKQISDPSLLDTLLMSEEIKRKVQEECNITLQHFYVVMSNLKKNKVIINNSIHPRLIPNVRRNKNGEFILMVSFVEDKFKEEEE